MNELEFSGSNLGGICEINILDVGNLSSMPIPINGIINGSVGNSEDWENLPVQDQVSELTETEIAGGNSMYRLSLTANIRKQASAKTHLLYELSKKRFLVDFKDQNGARRLAGTMDEGVSMRLIRNETRRQAKETNEYQIEFMAVRRFPIPFYSPS